MSKKIVWCLFSLFILLGFVFPIAASITPKREVERIYYVNWMYRNMELKVRQALNETETKEKLNYIYSRVEREKFPEVKLTLISIESRFNQKAIGSSGERCLMQVSPSWVQKLKVVKTPEYPNGIITNAADLTNDIDRCIAAGSYIFDQVYDQYSNITDPEKRIIKAVEAYNGGGDVDYLEKFLHTRGSMGVAQDGANHQYKLINPEEER